MAGADADLSFREFGVTGEQIAGGQTPSHEVDGKMTIAQNNLNLSRFNHACCTGETSTTELEPPDYSRSMKIQ
jgi:hypothetical protein